MNGDGKYNNGVEAEYTDIASRNAWAQVYQKIGRECHAYGYTCTEAKKLENKPLNRYRDVNPYDHSRVILKRCNRDYINANLVKMERANRKYILTQGPLAFTVGHFWLMVWEQRSKAILMLNKVIEKNEPKCHWYWPQAVGEEHKMELADVGLTVEQINEENYLYYFTRLFRIVDISSGESREVIQFHYTTWPDFGVPSSPVVFLEFLQRVRASGALEPEAGPAVVHCSAGIGRSGTFCLVDSCLVLIEKDGIESVNVQKVLLEMRRDRMGLIQTADQLRFSYEAIIEGARRLESEAAICARARVPRTSTDSPESDEHDEPEEEAPMPPPRGESLSRPPARPLPSIPVSESLGNIHVHSRKPATPPPMECSPLESPAQGGVSASSADDEDDEPTTESAELVETVRRRRNRELTDRIATIKRRARDAERWHERKRSLYKPLTIGFGLLLTGVAIYAYFKR